MKFDYLFRIPAAILDRKTFSNSRRALPFCSFNKRTGSWGIAGGLASGGVPRMFSATAGSCRRMVGD
jgi:hypothetical protein